MKIRNPLILVFFLHGVLIFGLFLYEAALLVFISNKQKAGKPFTASVRACRRGRPCGRPCAFVGVNIWRV